MALLCRSDLRSRMSGLGRRTDASICFVVCVLGAGVTVYTPPNDPDFQLLVLAPHLTPTMRWIPDDVIAVLRRRRRATPSIANAFSDWFEPRRAWDVGYGRRLSRCLRRHRSHRWPRRRHAGVRAAIHADLGVSWRRRQRRAGRGIKRHNRGGGRLRGAARASRFTMGSTTIPGRRLTSTLRCMSAS